MTSNTINLPMDVAREIAKYNDQTHEIEKLKEENAKMKGIWATGNKKMLKLEIVDGGGYPQHTSFLEVDIQGIELYLTFIKRREHMINNVYQNMTFLPERDDPDYDGMIYHCFGQHLITIGLAHGGGGRGYDCLLDFDEDGVRFTVVDFDADFGGLSINEFNIQPSFIIKTEGQE